MLNFTIFQALMQPLYIFIDCVMDMGVPIVLHHNHSILNATK